MLLSKSFKSFDYLDAKLSYTSNLNPTETICHYFLKLLSFPLLLKEKNRSSLAVFPATYPPFVGLFFLFACTFHRFFFNDFLGNGQIIFSSCRLLLSVLCDTTGSFSRCIFRSVIFCTFLKFFPPIKYMRSYFDTDVMVYTRAVCMCTQKASVYLQKQFSFHANV